MYRAFGQTAWIPLHLGLYISGSPGKSCIPRHTRSSAGLGGQFPQSHISITIVELATLAWESPNTPKTWTQAIGCHLVSEVPESATVLTFSSARLLFDVTRAPILLILAAVPCLAAELKPEAVQAYDRYIHDT